jgi:hypothetical protein
LPNACKQQTPIASITTGRACAAREGSSEPRDSGNPIVNRPFSAFATLMTLLALAMFAVSSTSRSTTLKPVRSMQRSRQSGFRIQREALEVSDRKSDVGGRRLEVGPKQIAMKSREQSIAATTTGAELAPLSTRNKDLRAAMRTIQVVVTDNWLARVETFLTMDDRSHYDPAYDLVVYGIRYNAASMPRVETEFQAAPENLANELDLIFHELASRQSQQPLPQAGAMQVERKWIRWKALAVAAGGWLKYHACRVMALEAASGVEWADYAELADRAIARNVASNETAGTSDATMGVRSSGWLRHSAASSLHQLSLMFEAVATELDGAGRATLSAVAK